MNTIKRSINSTHTHAHIYKINIEKKITLGNLKNAMLQAIKRQQMLYKRGRLLF